MNGAVGYGSRVSDSSAGTGSPAGGPGPGRGIQLAVGDGTVVTISGLPRAVGDAVLAAEPLRHGLGNARHQPNVAPPPRGRRWARRGPGGGRASRCGRGGAPPATSGMWLADMGGTDGFGWPVNRPAEAIG